MKMNPIIVALIVSLVGCATYAGRTSVTYFPASSADSAIITQKSQLFGQVQGYLTLDEARYGQQEPLKGAIVRIQGTTVGTYTDTNGFYKIDKIPSGLYEVQALMSGFKITSARNVRISSDGSVKINFLLEEKKPNTVVY